MSDAAPSMEGYEQTEVPTQDLAFIAENTLKTLTAPANLNSGELHDIYIKRQDDFEEPELLEVQYADSRGALIRELIFVDPVYAEKRPRICVSIEGVQAMHRAVGVLSRKVDNLVHSLRACRAAYYHELTSLREQMYQVSFAMEQGTPSPNRPNIKAMQHEALYFDPSQFDTSISDEILERKLKDATKDISEKLKASREEVQRLEKRLRLYERDVGAINDPRNRIERLLESVTLEKLLDMVRAAMGRANQDDFYEVIRNLLNEWKIEKGMEPDKTIEEELEEAKKQIKHLLAQVHDTQIRSDQHRKETDEVKKTLVTEREQAKVANNALMEQLEAARKEMEQMRESVRGVESQTQQQTRQFEEKKEKMEERLKEITAELAEKEQALKRYVAAKRIAEAGAGKKVENLSPAEFASLAMEKLNKQEVLSMVTEMVSHLTEDEKAQLAILCSGGLPNAARERVLKTMLQEGITPAVVDQVTNVMDAAGAQKMIRNVKDKFASKEKREIIKPFVDAMEEEDRVTFCKSLPDQTLKAVVVESVNNLSQTVATHESDSEDSVEEGKEGKVLFDPANDLNRKARRALLQKLIKRLPGHEIKQLAMSMGPKARAALFDTVFEEQDCESIRRAAGLLSHADAVKAFAMGLTDDGTTTIAPFIINRLPEDTLSEIAGGALGDFRGGGRGNYTRAMPAAAGRGNAIVAGVSVQTDLQGVALPLLAQEQTRKLNRLAGRPTSGPNAAKFSSNRGASKGETTDGSDDNGPQPKKRRGSGAGRKSLEVPDVMPAGKPRNTWGRRKRYDSSHGSGNDSGNHSEAGSRPPSEPATPGKPQVKSRRPSVTEISNATGPRKSGSGASSLVARRSSGSKSSRPGTNRSEKSEDSERSRPSFAPDLEGLNPNPRGFTPGSAPADDVPGSAGSGAQRLTQKSPTDSETYDVSDSAAQAQMDALQSAAEQRREVEEDVSDDDEGEGSQTDSDNQSEDHQDMEEDDAPRVSENSRRDLSSAHSRFSKRSEAESGRPSEIDGWIKKVFPTIESSAQTAVGMGGWQEVKIQIEDSDATLERNCVLEMCDMVLAFFKNLEQSGVARRAVKIMKQLEDSVLSTRDMVRKSVKINHSMLSGQLSQMLKGHEGYADQIAHEQTGLSESTVSLAARHTEAVSMYGPDSAQAAAASSAYAEAMAADFMAPDGALAEVNSAAAAHIQAVLDHGEGSVEATAASRRYTQALMERTTGQGAESEYAAQAAYTQAVAETVVANSAEAMYKFEDAVVENGGFSDQAISASRRYVEMMAQCMGITAEALIQPVMQSQSVMHQESAFPPEALAAAACYCNAETHSDAMPEEALQASAAYHEVMEAEGGLPEEALKASDSFARALEEQASIPQAVLTSSMSYTKNRLLALAAIAEAKPAESEDPASGGEKSSDAEEHSRDAAKTAVSGMLFKALEAQRVASEMQLAHAQQAEMARVQQRTSGASPQDQHQSPMVQHLSPSVQLHRPMAQHPSPQQAQQIQQAQQQNHLEMQLAELQNAAAQGLVTIADAQLPTEELAQKFTSEMQAAQQQAAQMQVEQMQGEAIQAAEVSKSERTSRMPSKLEQNAAAAAETQSPPKKPPGPLGGLGNLGDQLGLKKFVDKKIEKQIKGVDASSEAPAASRSASKALESVQNASQADPEKVSVLDALINRTSPPMLDRASPFPGRIQQPRTVPVATNQEPQESHAGEQQASPDDITHPAGTPQKMQQGGLQSQAPQSIQQEQSADAEDSIVLKTLYSNTCAKHGPASPQALALSAAVAETAALEVGLPPELAGAAAFEARNIVESIDQNAKLVAATNDFAEAMQKYAPDTAEAAAASESYVEMMTKQASLPVAVAAAKGAQVCAIAQHGERSGAAARASLVLVQAVAEQVAIAAKSAANSRIPSRANSRNPSRLGTALSQKRPTPPTYGAPRVGSANQAQGQTGVAAQEQQRQIQEEEEQIQEERRKSIFAAESVQSSSTAIQQAIEDHGLQSEEAVEASVAYTEAVAVQSGLPPETVAEVTAHARAITETLAQSTAPAISHHRASLTEAMVQHGPCATETVEAAEEYAEAIASSGTVAPEVAAAAGAQAKSIAQHGADSEEAANATVAYVQAVAESAGAIARPPLAAFKSGSPPNSQGSLASSALRNGLSSAEAKLKVATPRIHGASFISELPIDDALQGSKRKEVSGDKIKAGDSRAPSSQGNYGLTKAPTREFRVPPPDQHVASAWARIRAIGKLHAIKVKKEPASGPFPGLAHNMMAQQAQEALRYQAQEVMQTPTQMPMMPGFSAPTASRTRPAQLFGKSRPQSPDRPDSNDALSTLFRRPPSAELGKQPDKNSREAAQADSELASGLRAAKERALASQGNKDLREEAERAGWGKQAAQSLEGRSEGETNRKNQHSRGPAGEAKEQGRRTTSKDKSLPDKANFVSGDRGSTSHLTDTSIFKFDANAPHVGRKGSVDWGQELASLPNAATARAERDLSESSGFTSSSEGEEDEGTKTDSRPRSKSGYKTGLDPLVITRVQTGPGQAKLQQTAAVLRKEVEKGLLGEVAKRNSTQERMDAEEVRELEDSIAATAMQNFIAITSFLKSSGVDLVPGTEADQMNDRLAEAHAHAVKSSVDSAVQIYKRIQKPEKGGDSDDGPLRIGKERRKSLAAPGRPVQPSSRPESRAGDQDGAYSTMDNFSFEEITGLNGANIGGKLRAPVMPKKTGDKEEVSEQPPERPPNAEEWLNFFQGKSGKRNSIVVGNPAFAQPMNESANQRLGLRTRLKPLRTTQKNLPGMQVGTALVSTKLQDQKASVLSPGAAVAKDRQSVSRQNYQMAENLDNGSLEDALEIRAGASVNKRIQQKWRQAATVALTAKPPLPGTRFANVIQSAREAAQQEKSEQMQSTTPRLKPLADQQNYQVDANRWLVSKEELGPGDMEGPRSNIAPQRFAKKREGVFGKKLAPVPGAQANAQKLGESQGDSWLQVGSLGGGSRAPSRGGSLLHEAKKKDNDDRGDDAEYSESSSCADAEDGELNVRGAGHHHKSIARKDDVHIAPESWRAIQDVPGSLPYNEEEYEQIQPHSARIIRGHHFGGEEENRGSLTERAIVPHGAKSPMEGRRRRSGSDTIGSLVSRVREQLERTNGSLAASWVNIESQHGEAGLTLGGLQRGMVEAGVLPDDAGMLIQAILESQMSSASATIPGDRAPHRADFIAALMPGKLQQKYYDAAQRRASSGGAWWSEGRISPNFHIARCSDGLSGRDANTILTSRPTIMN